jgi:type I restriction enzyme S subunit
MAKKPNIRFAGFEDDWEQRKVYEMFKVTRGYVLPATDTSEEISDEMPYPVYSSQTKDNGLMGYYSDYLYEDAITWTTDGANAGTVNFRYGRFYCTNVCGVLLSDKVEASKAVAEALNNVAKRYVSYVGNPKLMNNVMADIQIKIPTSREERAKISSYFSNLDHLITLHQRKCDELKKVKKFMLQKMFPKKGEKNPEIRFDGFTNDWEQRKVGDITKELSEYAKLNSGLPLLTSARTGLMYQSDYRGNSTTDNENTLFSIVPLNACTYRHMSDDSTFHINVNTLEKGLVSKEYPVFVENESDLRFVVQYINSSDSFTKFCTEQKKGGTRTRLYYKTLCEYKMLIPSLNEQHIIADYFDNLDHLITLHQRKCEELKNVKKYMLQNMFAKGE